LSYLHGYSFSQDRMEGGSNHILMKTRKQTKNHPELPRKIAPRFMGFDQICMVAPLEGVQVILDAPLTLCQGDGCSPRVKMG
jgi:hypothetical protein